MNRNPRTTILGATTIALALLLAAKQLLSGQMLDVAALAGQIAAGVGLITAADAGTTGKG